MSEPRGPVPPVTEDEEAKFRESVRLLGGDENYALHWSNNAMARLLATLDLCRADLDGAKRLNTDLLSTLPVEDTSKPVPTTGPRRSFLGYSAQPADPQAPSPERLREAIEALPAWVKDFDDGSGATVVRLNDVLRVLAAAPAPVAAAPGLDGLTRTVTVESLAAAMWNVRIEHPRGFITHEDRAAAIFAALAPAPLAPDPVLFDKLEAAAYQAWEVIEGQGLVTGPLDPTLAMNIRDALYMGPFGHGSTQDVPHFEGPEMAADHDARQGR